MSYSHLLVCVAVTPESHLLVDRAVSIARPLNARISLVTLAAEPEMYNHLAAPMLENIREVLQEETQQFLRELEEKAHYPVARTYIATGELSEHILDICRKENIDLVICGNHNQSFFSRAACSAKAIVGSSQVDVLLVPLGGINPPRT
ncbi:universal stress protein UspC [Huaxiibacter chinensis]|jgi:universal stress protein C|uniref:universal stress protein UspC n=1 Tax=Huaxiibacter chinensis TaxID=2899785 RepID=UPI003D32324A